MGSIGNETGNITCNRPGWIGRIILGLLLSGCAGNDRAAFLEEEESEPAGMQSTVEAPCERGEPPDGRFQLTDALMSADYWLCEPPPAGNGPLDVDDVEGTQATVTGSTARFEIDWSGRESAAGDDLLFWMGNNAAGYFRMPIAPATSDEPVVDGQPLSVGLRIAEAALAGPVPLSFAMADAAETDNPPVVGAIGQARMDIISVGSGDVQVNLNWRTLVDLDLSVFDPDGVEIYFGNPMSPSGGTLDLDSRAVCSFDDRGAGNENIFWPAGEAPTGEYRVAVNMFSDCGTFDEGLATDFAVTVILHGTDVSVYEGTFVEGEPSTQDVTTFTLR